MTDRTDVFPGVKLDPGRVARLPRKPNFRELVRNYPDSRFAFIIYLNHFTVYYKLLPWTEKCDRHIKTSAKNVNPPADYTMRDWMTVVERLRRDININKSNTDVRTCFKWNLNFFLVKSSFTFGLRTTEPDTVHLYQIGDVAVRFYFVDPLYRRKNMTKRDKFFPVQEMGYYSKRTLYPHTDYAVPPNTRYFIFTTNKSFFSVHVVDVSEQPLPFSCVNPLLQVQKRPADPLYERPVKTPRIEEVVIDEDDEGPCSSSSVGRYPEGSSDVVPEDDGPCSSSGVLMNFENGSSLTDDSVLMPPPQTFIIHLPIQDRVVKVVSPDVIEWYKKNFKYREYASPVVTITSSSMLAEPLDLTAPAPTAPEPTAPEPPAPTAPEPEPLPTAPTAPEPEPLPTTSANAPPEQPLNVNVPPELKTFTTLETAYETVNALETEPTNESLNEASPADEMYDFLMDETEEAVNYIPGFEFLDNDLYG